jgi:hypothetical protein
MVLLQKKRIHEPVRKAGERINKCSGMNSPISPCKVTSLLLIANSYGTEAAMGFLHTFFRPLLFIIAFILLILVSIIIGCMVKVKVMIREKGTDTGAGGEK